ncbi:uncharacterized protein LOC113209854 isoform X2 [Frankliniella occidentalis]|uniref:Uncharacterized protein LOC113209854 isoform X2 n=1 Tax=Frankliniella occidentalis TaxID=133901 RepID=A0A6J1SQ31_FRAOC|nr:uncharacterized protein LOC113209854 isoform X2 [Frankliniella occidentalis]
MTTALSLLIVLAVCTGASAEYLYEDDAVEDLGMRVSHCLQHLPAVTLRRPSDPSARPEARPLSGVVVRPGNDVCVRLVMETLWEEGSLDEARNTVASCLFDYYQTAFEAVAVPDSSPEAAVLWGLECAISALSTPITPTESFAGNEK